MNFAIIGCGRICKKHIKAIAENYNDIRLVALCDLVKDKATYYKKYYYDMIDNYELKKLKFNGIKVYTDYTEMLENENIDCVSIATETGYHASIALKCLQLGKNVLVEKPMAMSLKEADELINYADSKNLKLGVCLQNRFNKPIQLLKKAVDNNGFGKLINITARILWNRDQQYYNQSLWRGTKKLDGGTLMNQCIHNIDILQWIVNSNVKRIYCERGTFLRNIEMEDFGAILIRFENNVIGIVEGSACVYPKNLEESLSVFGEKGTAVVGGLALNKILTWKFEDNKYNVNGIFNKDEDIENIYGNGHVAVYKDFYDAVRLNIKPYIDGVEGRKSLKIILDAYDVSCMES